MIFIYQGGKHFLLPFRVFVKCGPSWTSWTECHMLVKLGKKKKIRACESNGWVSISILEHLGWVVVDFGTLYYCFAFIECSY